jgi:hypothetical protein
VIEKPQAKNIAKKSATWKPSRPNAIGEQVPNQIVLKSIRVDASNVDQYLGKGF